MEELASEEHSVVVAQDLPVIEDMEEKSVAHRAGKLASKMINTELFGEFDLFGNPLTLKFDGEDNHKTEFGGIMFLAIATVTITLTVIYMFPDGLVVNSKITEYSLLQDNGQGMTVFDHTDCFMRMFYWSKPDNGLIKGDLLRWLLPKVSAYQVVNTSSGSTVTPLELIFDYDNGYIYLNKTAVNANTKLYTAGTYNASIRVEPLFCDLMETHPVYGMCWLVTYYSGYTLGVDFAAYQPKTNGLSSTRIATPVNPMSVSVINMDVTKFNTNSKFFGFIANVLNYDILYFNPWPEMYANNKMLRYDISIVYSSYRDDCLVFGDNYRCSIFDVVYSGTTTYVEEKFDDITAPMLFFISLSQTLFFLVYFLFLNNYSNNAFKLDLADQLVYIADPEGRHYDFKSGPAVFFACLWHNHFAVKALDWVLYRFWETHSRRILPLRMQLAMDMIDYGHACMIDRNFYGELNDIYSQENAQPSKIIFDYDQEEKEEKEEEEEPDCYFNDEVREEAFKRMCEEHEYYSVERKKYLRDLLLETDKKYKLVLMAQDLFEGYCTRVRNEGHVKEIELPITFQNEELSGQNLKKESFY